MWPFTLRNPVDESRKARIIFALLEQDIDRCLAERKAARPARQAAAKRGREARK